MNKKGPGLRIKPKDRSARAAALPSLFQIIHQTWEVVLTSPERIHSNPRLRFYLQIISFAEQTSALNMAASAHLGDVEHVDAA